MSSVAEKQKERIEIRNDLVAHKKPKRVLLNIDLYLEAACELANIDIRKAYYNPDLMEQAMDKICATFPTDTFPLYPPRNTLLTQFIGSKSNVMGSDGTWQRADYASMSPDEYDDFIKDPYKFIVEVKGPRVTPGLGSDTATRSMRLAAAFNLQQKYNGHMARIRAKLTEKYGYGPAMVTGLSANAPFDFISNNFRSFSGIMKDVYRCPDKVKAAVEAALPLLLKRAIPPGVQPGQIAFVALHAGPFLNKKIFAEIYWPTLEKVILELEKNGIGSTMFVESNWQHLIPYLETLPKTTNMFMEYGDPKVFAETVGKNHVIGGFYDATMTLTKSKEECIDEAKRLLDIVMKTEKYYFCFSKALMSSKSVDVPKVQAVLEWVAENAKY